MSDQAAQLERALAIFAKSGPVLRTSDALALGIRPKTLYLLRDEGHIIVLDRGLYRLTTAEAFGPRRSNRGHRPRAARRNLPFVGPDSPTG